MSQAAPVIINDGTINRTFSPISTSAGLTRYLNRDSASSAGFGELTVSFSQASATRETDRSTIRLAVPREDTVNGVPVVTSIPRFHVDLIMPSGMTATDRAEFFNLTKNLLANAIYSDLVSDLDPPY